MSTLQHLLLLPREILLALVVSDPLHELSECLVDRFVVRDPKRDSFSLRTFLPFVFLRNENCIEGVLTYLNFLCPALREPTLSCTLLSPTDFCSEPDKLRGNLIAACYEPVAKVKIDKTTEDEAVLVFNGPVRQGEIIFGPVGGEFWIPENSEEMLCDGVCKLADVMEDIPKNIDRINRRAGVIHIPEDSALQYIAVPPVDTEQEEKESWNATCAVVYFSVLGLPYSVIVATQDCNEGERVTLEEESFFRLMKESFLVFPIDLLPDLSAAAIPKVLPDCFERVLLFEEVKICGLEDFMRRFLRLSFLQSGIYGRHVLSDDLSPDCKGYNSDTLSEEEFGKIMEESLWNGQNFLFWYRKCFENSDCREHFESVCGRECMEDMSQYIYLTLFILNLVAHDYSRDIIYFTYAMQRILTNSFTLYETHQLPLFDRQLPPDSVGNEDVKGDEGVKKRKGKEKRKQDASTPRQEKEKRKQKNESMRKSERNRPKKHASPRSKRRHRAKEEHGFSSSASLSSSSFTSSSTYFSSNNSSEYSQHHRRIRTAEGRQRSKPRSNHYNDRPKSTPVNRSYYAGTDKRDGRMNYNDMHQHSDESIVNLDRFKPKTDLYRTSTEPEIFLHHPSSLYGYKHAKRLEDYRPPTVNTDIYNERGHSLSSLMKKTTSGKTPQKERSRKSPRKRKSSSSFSDVQRNSKLEERSLRRSTKSFSSTVRRNGEETSVLSEWFTNGRPMMPEEVETILKNSLKDIRDESNTLPIFALKVEETNEYLVRVCGKTASAETEGSFTEKAREERIVVSSTFEDSQYNSIAFLRAQIGCPNVLYNALKKLPSEFPKWRLCVAECEESKPQLTDGPMNDRKAIQCGGETSNASDNWCTSGLIFTSEGESEINLPKKWVIDVWLKFPECSDRFWSSETNTAAESEESSSTIERKDTSREDRTLCGFASSHGVCDIIFRKGILGVKSTDEKTEDDFNGVPASLNKFHGWHRLLIYCRERTATVCISGIHCGSFSWPTVKKVHLSTIGNSSRGWHSALGIPMAKFFLYKRYPKKDHVERLFHVSELETYTNVPNPRISETTATWPCTYAICRKDNSNRSESTSSIIKVDESSQYFSS